MQEQLFKIIKDLCRTSQSITLDQNLKTDLKFDSVLLVQLAVKMHQEFAVDLGELADQGKEFNTVKDLLLCLKN